jgi:hypothetical protein
MCLSPTLRYRPYCRRECVAMILLEVVLAHVLVAVHPRHCAQRSPSFRLLRNLGEGKLVEDCLR